ncbi:Bud-site selection protein [Dissophora ornata]|nr:hypothetical protein BGZ58_007068 [Dissophora ornata]KAI8604383.1 Bud-site selection protein [Dissophora ornata]
MTMKNKGEHKGGKKNNLGWEIIKLQAQVGETTSRKAKKVVEAERKKEGTAISSTSTGVESEALEDAEKAAVSEATQKLQKLKEQKISQKIYQAKKEIRRAFVKAKTGETQRLIKRLKEARKAVDNKSAEPEVKDESSEEAKPAHKKKQDLTEEDVVKFEHELELVKKMDIDSLSEHAFVTKLSKHPILGSHTLMEPYVGEAKIKKGNGDIDPLIQIIEARLTNTKTVKEQMAKLWDELEHIVTGKKVDHEALKNKKRKADEVDGADHEEQLQENKKSKTKDTNHKVESNIEQDEDSDEDGDEFEDMSDISDEEHDDGYDSDGLPLPKNGKASATSSMFIGSLNESHSKKDKKNKNKDKNDWVDDKFDEIYGKIKKNRPGQRARRAKAELKFGKDANHVKKAEEEARLREERKAARKAKQEKFKARDASSANAQKLPNRRMIGAGDGSASVHQPVAAPKPRTPSGPDPNDPTLHPSWLAKQSEKAALAAALSGAKSSKIVFDDSD